MRIIVTPTTAASRLAVLTRCLTPQKDSFDEWHIWPNTADAEELRALRALCGATPWMRLVDVAYDYSSNVSRYYKTACDPGSVYLRLDDTVAWLAPGFVDTMFAAATAHYGSAFSVHANAVGNPGLAQLHARLGVAPRGPAYATGCHAQLLGALGSGGGTDAWTFGFWRLWDYERVAQVAVAWNGSEFQQFEGRVSPDIDDFLSAARPSRIGRSSVVCGRALCATCDDASLAATYAALTRAEPAPAPVVVSPQAPEPVPEPAPTVPEPEPAPSAEPDTSTPPAQPPAAAAAAPPPAPRKKRATRRATTVV